jgi:hypothetical protein
MKKITESELKKHTSRLKEYMAEMGRGSSMPQVNQAPGQGSTANTAPPTGGALTAGQPQGTAATWPTTPDAIKSFQKSKGLTADGLIGQKTMAALTAAGITPPAGFKPVANKAPAPKPVASTAGAPTNSTTEPQTGSSGRPQVNVAQNGAAAAATPAAPENQTPGQGSTANTAAPAGGGLTTAQAQGTAAPEADTTTAAAPAGTSKPAVNNPYTDPAQAAKFAALTPQDQAWLTKGGGKPDINDELILSRAPNKGRPATATPAASAEATPAAATTPATTEPPKTSGFGFKLPATESVSYTEDQALARIIQLARS